jgi:adenosylcobinamide-GDP ribazoletransferase
MRSLLAAVQFLTRIPVPLRDANEREIGRSAFFFPIVGLLLGGILLASYHVLAMAFPVLVARTMVFVILILLSGAFHLDGLSDSVDAFYAGHDREDCLRIMKDPHVGAMGVIAIGSVLVLKVAAGASLAEGSFRAAILSMPVVGHAAMVGALALPYSRPAGLGKAFADHRSAWDLALAVALATGAVFVSLKIAGLGALLAAALSAAGFLAFAWRKIRGVSGDVCGATNEIAETGFLLALTSLAPLSFGALEKVFPESFWRWHP